MMPTTVLYSRGVPSIDLGKQGDYCIDVLGVRMYGPKNKNRQWGPGVPLTGLQGMTGDDGYGAQWRYPRHYKAGAVVALGDVGFVECEIEHDSESLQIPAIPGRAPVVEAISPFLGSGDGNRDNLYTQLRQEITNANINIEENCLELDEAIWGKYIYEGMPNPAIRIRVGHFHSEDAYSSPGVAKTPQQLAYSPHPLQFRGRLSLGTATAFPASGYEDVNHVPLAFNDTDIYTFISYGTLEYAIMVNDAYCMNFADPSALDGTLIITREGTTDTVIIDSLIHGESTSIVGNPPGRVVLRNAVESWITTGTAPTQMPTFTNGLGAQESFNSSPNEHAYYLRRIEPGKYRLWNEGSNTAMTFTSKGTRGAGGLTVISACNMTRHLQQQPELWKNVMFIGDYCYVKATRLAGQEHPENIAIKPIDFDKVYILQRDWAATDINYNQAYPFERLPDSHSSSDAFYRIREAVQGSPWLTFGNDDWLTPQNGVMLVEVFPNELPAHTDTPTWEEIKNAPCFQYVKRSVRGFFSESNIAEATPDIPERAGDYAPGKPAITLPAGAVGVTSVKSAGNDTICLLRPVLGSPNYLIGREEEAQPLSATGFTAIGGGVEPTDGAAFTGLGATALTKPILTIWRNNTVGTDGLPVFNHTKTEETVQLMSVDDAGRVELSADPTPWMNQEGGKRSFWGAFEFHGATPPVVEEHTLYLFVEEKAGYSIFRIGATTPVNFPSDDPATDGTTAIAGVMVARYVNGHRTGQVANLRGIKNGLTVSGVTQRDVVDFGEATDVVFDWCTGPLIAGTSPAGCFRAQLPPNDAGQFIPPEFQRTYVSGAIYGDYYFDGSSEGMTKLFRSGGKIDRGLAWNGSAYGPTVDTFISHIPLYAALEIEYIQKANALPLWRALLEALPDYHPENPGNWADVPPHTVGRALDRLASEIAAITKRTIYQVGEYDGLTLFNNEESAPTTGTVNGRIVDGITGENIAGADVYINGAGIPTDQFHTTTNGAGSFSFSGVPTQEVTIGTIITNYNGVTRNITVVSGVNNVSTMQAQRSTQQTFWGKLSNPDGPMFGGFVQDAIVEFQYFAFGTTYSIVGSHATPGELLPTGTPTITRLDGNMQPMSDTVRIAALQDYGSTAFPILVTLASNVNQWLSGALPPPVDGTVNGKVVDEVSGLAIAGATVAIGSITTTTNGAGSFSLAGIAVGTATVTVEADGYIAATRDINVILGVNELVTSFEMTYPIDISIGTVTGRVINVSDGVGIAGVYVAIGATEVRTNGGGTWTIFNVPIGPQTVTFHVTGFTSTQRNITVVYGANNAGNVALTGIGGSGGGSQTGTVTGTVVDSNGGAAIVGATVSVDGHTGTTNGSGAFSIAGVALGAQTVTVSATGYDDATADITVGTGSNATGAISITATVVVPGTGTVSGTIVDIAGGAAMSGVSVSIGLISTTTDVAGAFSLPGVALGAKTLLISFNGYDVISNNITVVSGANAQGTISMTATVRTMFSGKFSHAGAGSLPPEVNANDIYDFYHMNFDGVHDIYGAILQGASTFVNFADPTTLEGTTTITQYANGALTANTTTLVSIAQGNGDSPPDMITVADDVSAWLVPVQQGGGGSPNGFYGMLSVAGGTLPPEVNDHDVYAFLDFGGGTSFAMILAGGQTPIDFADPTVITGTVTVTRFDVGTNQPTSDTATLTSVSQGGGGQPDSVAITGAGSWVAALQGGGGGGGGGPSLFFGKFSNTGGGNVPTGATAGILYGFISLGGGAFEVVIPGGDGTPIDFGTSSIDNGTIVTHCDPQTFADIPGDTAILSSINQGAGPNGADTLNFSSDVSSWIVAG